MWKLVVPLFFDYIILTHRTHNNITDLSPQDSTLLSDIVEVGSLPNLTREDEETRYCFYVLTRHGLRYECSSASKLQVCSCYF